MLNHRDVESTRRESLQLMVRDRTLMEQKVQGWQTNLLKVPANILEKIPYDCTQLTLPIQVPEYYKDRPVESVVNEEIKAFNDKIAEINAVFDEYNTEAYNLLKEYNEMRAKE
ncbi:MAG: hypothetical protein IKL53_08125 [Lachnospiraceae bacterium]|nr:hypothetical protein [Lachnospiraceae bacterium]